MAAIANAVIQFAAAAIIGIGIAATDIDVNAQRFGTAGSSIFRQQEQL